MLEKQKIKVNHLHMIYNTLLNLNSWEFNNYLIMFPFSIVVICLSILGFYLTSRDNRMGYKVFHYGPYKGKKRISREDEPSMFRSEIRNENFRNVLLLISGIGMFLLLCFLLYMDLRYD